MDEQDGRKLRHETLEELRIRAVKQVEAGGKPGAGHSGIGVSPIEYL